MFASLATTNSPPFLCPWAASRCPLTHSPPFTLSLTGSVDVHGPGPHGPPLIPTCRSQILWMFTALTATTAALSIIFTLADTPRQWAAGSDLLLCLSILVSQDSLGRCP